MKKVTTQTYVNIDDINCQYIDIDLCNIAVMKDIGKRLALLRKERKVNQVDVAKAVGFVRSSLSQWENGNIKKMTIDYFMGLCGYYNVNPQWLYSGEGEKYVTLPTENAQKQATLTPPNDISTEMEEEVSMNQKALKEYFKCNDASLLYVAGVIQRAWKKGNIIEVYDDIIDEISNAKDNEVALRKAGIKAKNET